MSKFIVGCYLQRQDSCCGAILMHQFCEHSPSDQDFEEIRRDTRRRYTCCEVGDSLEEAWKKVLDKALEENKGYSIQFWFAKGCHNQILDEEFYSQELKNLVEAHPDCKKIAEYSNPNSGNLICGLMIHNETSLTDYLHCEDEESW